MMAALNYMTNVRDEFKNVTWPTKNEAGRLTLFVVSGSLLVGLFVGGVDALLVKGLSILIR